MITISWYLQKIFMFEKNLPLPLFWPSFLSSRPFLRCLSSLLSLSSRSFLSCLISRSSLLCLFLLLLGNPVLASRESEDLVGEKESHTDSPLWEDLSDPFSSVGQLRPWSQTLSTVSSDFIVPEALKTQIDFWKRIYSEVSQDQGVLHDTEDLSVVYDTISFADINRRTDINKFKKEILRKNRVTRAKYEWMEVLKRMSYSKAKSFPPPEGSLEEKIYHLWKKSSYQKTYKKAADNLRFQLGQRDKVVQGIYFSGRYLEDFEKIFEEQGLPKELTRLPFVESSFNIMARSRVGASGLWQLMPSVLNKREKQYQSVDVRNYPNEAAKIAARVLKNNFKMLNDWSLAVTGYNHGPTGVSNLVKRCRSSRIEDLAKLDLCKGKRLGFASRNFYPSFLAILEVERHATQYFGKVFWSNRLDGVEVKLPKKTSISKVESWFRHNKVMLQLYNPHILGETLRGKKSLEEGVSLFIPQDTLSQVRQSFNSSEVIYE
jgi:membrane-bound lytic murein transglycosylase D